MFPNVPQLVSIPQLAKASATDDRHPSHHLEAYLRAAGHAVDVTTVSLGLRDYAQLRSATVAWLRAHGLPADPAILPMPKFLKGVPQGYALLPLPAATP